MAGDRNYADKDGDRVIDRSDSLDSFYFCSSPGRVIGSPSGMMGGSQVSSGFYGR
jgi:hypothetical protein